MLFRSQTPSPHRFLLSKTKYPNKVEPLQLGLQHSGRQPSPQYHSKNHSVPSGRVDGFSASNLYTLDCPTAPNLTSPSNSVVVDPRIRTQKSQESHTETGTELGGQPKEGFGVGAATLVDGKGDRMNAGTARGRADGQIPGDEGPPMPMAKQMQTPRGSQFKAAPRFRFESSRRSQEGSPSGAENGINSPSHPTQLRWRATQTDRKSTRLNSSHWE